MNCSESLKLWLNELNSEIEFWDTLFRTRGAVGGDPEIFRYRTALDCPFQLPAELENVNSKILDVGSGPYSRLGYVFEGKKVDLTLVDPLAFAYKEIGKKHGIKFAAEPITGMVECLNLILPENTYDLVHMSNSLDHSFDPIAGIKQLLYVAKIGGKVVLRHHNNVAEQANYQGLHQWNLTTEDKKFFVWNRKERIDVNELLKDCATVEFADVSSESTLGSVWEYQKIVIRKNKRFDIESIYAGNIIVQLCEHIMMMELSRLNKSKMSKMQKIINVIANRL